MTGDNLALGAVAALTALGLVKRRGGRNLPPGGKERLVEMVRSGDPDQIAQAIEFSIGFGLKGLDLKDADLRPCQPQGGRSE